jgi:dienelactone hydrolase
LSLFGEFSSRFDARIEDPRRWRIDVYPISTWLITLVLAGAILLTSSFAMAKSTVLGDLPRKDGRPLESLPGLDTEYGVLEVNGARLRTLVTRPQDATGRLPAGLFVQWLSCDTIELEPDPDGGWSTMLARLLTESGMLWHRTEKSGVGDSTGPSCAQLDYETELEQHRAALRQLRARPDVDPQRIVVYGASMGSNYAPLLAADENLAGVVVWGGGAVTWFERMLRFERNALELGGADAATLSGEMNARAAFFARYLLSGESPAAIAADDATLGAVWPRIVGTSSDSHYGRPFAFHQQAQRQNWAWAWSRVRAPVLALYGQYDWFESRASVELIATLAERRAAGSAEFRELPQLDHHFTNYRSALDAFREENGRAEAGPAVEAILEWLERIGVRDQLASGAPNAMVDRHRRARSSLGQWGRDAPEDKRRDEGLSKASGVTMVR